MQIRTRFLKGLQPVLLLWVFAVLCLFGKIIIHDRSSVQLATAAELASERGPLETFVGRDNAWNIELYLHPECSCSRATLKLIDRLLNELQVRPNLTIYVASYEQMKANWLSSTNRQLASELDEAIVLEDKEAARAKSLGAIASGSLLITDGQGRQVFAGGITASRSCDTKNPSYFAIRNLLNNLSTEIQNTVVYGCAL